MSTFKVSVTPTRIQNQRKCEENRVPTIVELAPFTPKAVVDFRDIPVTKTAKRCLKLQNPTECDKKLLLTKILKPEYNARFSWTNTIIGAKSEIDLEIEWTPMKPFSAMETIQFTDDRGFKKDVSIVLKSVIVKDKTKRAVGLASANPTTKSRLKSQSPKKCATSKTISPVGVRRRSFSASSIHVRKFLQTEKVVSESTTTTITNVFDSFEFNETVDNNKENQNPGTPPNASVLFDKIQFTPITDTKSNVANKYEYLASCPTPASIPRNDHLLKPSNFAMKSHRPELSSNGHLNQISNKAIYTTSEYNTPKSHRVEKVFEPEVYSTISRSKQILHEQESVEITETRISYEEEVFDVSAKNETFEFEIANDSNSLENVSSHTYVKSPASSKPNSNQLLSVTQPLSSPQLSIIDEEERCDETNKLTKTFNLIVPERESVSPLNNIPSTPYIATPMRKIMSMHDVSRDKKQQSQTKKLIKCGQGSMPNLNDNDVNLIDSIENNRFFRTRSHTESQRKRNLDTNIIFSEKEICAQSSLFNLNEPTPSKRCRTFSDGRIEQRKSLERVQKMHKPVRMIITPPKNKPSGEDRLSTRAQPIRSTNWGKSIDKMIKPINSLVLKRKPNVEITKPLQPQLLGSNSSISSSTSSVYGTPRKNKQRPEATRVPLFDPDLYSQTFVNPDPFAATTTCDPFLTATFYLDQNAVEDHEEQFKKWLNALVTVPDDIETEQKIDLGKLFQDVKNKELQLAQTKENVSSKYFTKYRMISLRKVAFDLYRSHEMQLPISKVMQLIEKKQLAIRTDRNLHLDLVLQRNILELLLSFNPLWLRIALEIIFNEEIPMTSNKDMYGLSAFMINRLFRARFSEAKHSKSFTYSQHYAEQIKASALKYVLILVLFLDKAKEKRIIKHNPCLFVRNSKFKETRDVLIQFSSSVVANLGDITKYLKRIGYVLTHKQTYLDEFDYAFKNLAVDLRDGVRLTRVMEIILLRDGLSSGLRVPAISRLQKLHNVEIALKALAAADFHIMGDITAKDIVEGHREKTLSLLWQIIYKFRAPRFNAAAITIQRWWRQNFLKVIINRRIIERFEKCRYYAATRIQSLVRSYLSRKRTVKWITEKRIATVTIQTFIRRYQCRNRFLLIRKSVHRIQSWYRTQVITRSIRKEFLMKRSSAITIQKWYRRVTLARKLELAAPIIRSLKTTAKLRHEKALILQRVIKSYLLRNRFRTAVFNVIEYQKLLKDRNRIATRVQSYYRMYVERKRYLTMRNAVIKLQAAIRSKLARDRFIGMRNAAIILQNYYRSYFVSKRIRTEYTQLRAKSIWIQQRFRANRMMKQKRDEYLEIRKSCITIQNWRRRTVQLRNTRNEFIKKRNSSIVIQKYFRGYREMKKLRNEFLVSRNAAIKIQNRFRAWRLMKKQRAEYLKILKACACLQFNYRCIMERRRYILMKKSAISIQQRWRAIIDMRNERTKYIELKKSVLLIQRRFRSITQMKVQKMKFIQLRESTVALQRQFKAYILMKKQRETYILMRSSAITIQAQFRAARQMRHCRQQYLIIRRSTITIQKYFRNYLVTRTIRREYLQTRTACITIQSVMRQYIQRKQYQAIRSSAVTIQAQWRALLNMRKLRSEYINYRKSVIAVQDRFRANKEMKILRSEYVTLRSATITIQQQYRALIQMRQVRTEYTLIRSSVLCIQNRLRAYNLMIAERDRYNKMRVAATKLQEYYRGYRQMKTDRKDFQTQKMAAIRIQTRCRGFIDRTKYQNLRKAVVLIQLRWRALRAMQSARTRFVQIRESIILIQRKFRANKQMVVEHKKFVEIKQAADTIQQRWKALVTMRQVRERYILIRSSTITIQTYFRAVIAMRYERREYVLIRKSTICIQRYVRGYQLMRRDRANYINERKSIIRVQSFVRSHIQRKHYIQLQKSAVLLQARYRALLAMRHERHTFITKKTSVITIQKYFRGYLMMKRDQNVFQMQRASAIKIQSRIRGFIHRCQYLKLKDSALVVQQRYRAQLEMRRYRYEYIKIKKSVTIIQTYYRSVIIARQIRTEFITQRKAAIKIQSIYRGFIQRRQYIKIITSIRIIQIRIRAMLAMKAQLSDYQALKKSVLLTQRHYRAIREMRYARTEYLTQRSAAIKIQTIYRGFIQRRQYIKIITSVRIIQIRIRATLAMKGQQSYYQSLKNSVILVQRNYRAIQAMRQERIKYLAMRGAAITIQQRYRAQLQMKYTRNQYLLLRAMLICIQRKFRAYQLMKVERTRYLQMQSSARIIQQKFRATQLMRMERERYLKFREVIIVIQAHARGYAARNRFFETWTPKAILRRRYDRAALKIQKMWRGFHVRRRLPRNFKAILAKAHEQTRNQSGERKESVSLGVKTAVRLLNLGGNFKFTVLYPVLTRLDYITRHVPMVFDAEDARFLAEFCYMHLHSAIRSEDHKITIELCCKILLNLARYKPVTNEVFQIHLWVSIGQTMLRWCDKDCRIFNTICTLLWLFMDCPIRKKKIKKFLSNDQSKFSLREVKKLVARKDYMLKKVKSTKLNEREYSQYDYPSFAPDFGVVKTKPYIFINPVFALDVVLRFAGITDII